MGGCCCKSSNSEIGGIDIFQLSNQDTQSVVSSIPVEWIGLESSKTPSWLSFEDQEELDKNIYLNDNCFICLEDFNDLLKQPRIIPCGHVICNECLIGLARLTLFTKVKCPQDRQIFRVAKRPRTGAQMSFRGSISIQSESSISLHSFLRGSQLFSDDLQENSNSDVASIESFTLTPAILNGSSSQNVENNSSNSHFSDPSSEESLSDVAYQHPSHAPQIVFCKDGSSFYEPPPDYPMEYKYM
ncbi:uncharacterized protein LOC111109446 isoform X2 [Crassostrea virginica]